MNKFLVFVSLTLFASVTVSADVCDLANKSQFDKLEFVDMKSTCVQLTEDQIEKEITASLKYLSYGAYFSRDDINRPGFANFFFNAASEEREHAEKLIEYLSMRGRYFEDMESPITKIKIGKLIKNAEKAEALKLGDGFTAPLKSGKVSAGLDSLRNALKMEMQVTASIKNLIKVCESEEKNGENDYHFVDYLTGEFLSEQYQGKRDIAGKLSTLSKMINTSGAELADFLFDKKLQ